MDLTPRHRTRLDLPADWDTLLQSCLDSGALWLHGGDKTEDLVAWAESRLTSRWDGRAWQTDLDGSPIQLPPWEALASVLPRTTGIWIGAATYELACDEGNLPRKPLNAGQMGQSWGSVTQALHRKDGRMECWSWEPEPPDIEAWTLRLRKLLLAGPRSSPTLALLSLEPEWDEKTHRAAVGEIQTCILDGAFYVANLCVPFHANLPAGVGQLGLRAMRQARPPFGALVDLGDLRLLSLSMERLLSRRGERIWSQPIKGSAPLIGDPEVDSRTARLLAADPKERAEHTMILDLVRNDLGRVALPGSVQVSQYMALEPYPTVMHLVSTVEAVARPHLGLAELLRTALPGGSVTGAPKHAVCRHLARVEAAPRGFYCGALGWIAANGDMDLALPIRTAQIEGNFLTYWTGGGITRRSDPAREWQELYLKTHAITP